MLCPGCGNEIEEASACPICENHAAPRRTKRADDAGRANSGRGAGTSFCQACGNTIYGSGPCDICSGNNTPCRRTARATELCPKCGNEVVDASECPICTVGRGGGRARRGKLGIAICLNCAVPMEAQQWDDVEVHMCTDCQAILFPPGALEAILDKLRDASEDLEFEEVLRELRSTDAPRRLSKSIRYRNCPVCDESMTRRNYGRASGIIVEQCTNHGIWVEQQTFAELSDWISRGGDQLTRRVAQRRTYQGPQFGR